MTVTADAERDLGAAADGALRAATAGDALDGIGARWVAEPSSAGAMAAVLAWCTAHAQPVVIRGGGSHLSWGRRPSGLAVIAATRRLDRIERYEPGDLTVSVAAGLTVRELNRALAPAGQWLPVDAPSDRTTVGGMLATNDSGPLRHRYGTPRDQVIGVRLATADGRVASAGGQVVKNVAGYDLGKLVAGSFGTLGAIVGATFKLAPVPKSTATVSATFESGGAVAEAAAAVNDSQLDALCLDVSAVLGHSPRYVLLARFGGTPAATGEQASAAAALVASARPLDTRTLDAEADRVVWDDQTRRASNRDAGIEVRASWLPARLGQVLTLLDALCRDLGLRIECTARAGVGAGAFHLDGDAPSMAAAVDRLRQRPDTVAHVVVTRSPAAFRDRTDAWGPPAAQASITAALKRALDPAGVLNASRGPI
jgi:glycolate oxidase FAD binding subunit